VRNGYNIFATQHTGEEFLRNGVNCAILHKVSEKRKPNILDYITSKEIKLVINIPSHQGEPNSRRILKDEYLIRRKATEFGIPVVTNLQLAKALIKALLRKENGRRATVNVKALAQSTGQLPEAKAA